MSDLDTEPKPFVYKQPPLKTPLPKPGDDAAWVHPTVGGCLFLAGPLGWLFLIVRFIRYQNGTRFHTPTWEKVVATIIMLALASQWIGAIGHALSPTVTR